MVMNMCGRGDKDIFTVAEHLGDATDRMTHPHRPAASRAARRANGRAALVTFLMARRSRPARPRCAILKALPAAGADVIELGMPFTDPMADGPAIQAAGLRALKAGQTLVKTLDLVRRVPRGRRRHADRADGLLQPDLHLRRRRASCADAMRPASTA